MSDIKSTLLTLINAVNSIIVNCTNAQELLLATKASSVLLNTASDNATFESIDATIDTINKSIVTHGLLSDCIESLFSLYDKLIAQCDAIIDVYMVARSLKGLIDTVTDSIVLIDSEQSMDQFNTLIVKSEALIDAMVAKITSLSADIDDGQRGFFVSKLSADIDSIHSSITDGHLHYQSIEQLNVKLDSSISDTNQAISALTSTVNAISTRLTDTHTLLNSLIANKANPHEVTKEQVGLEHALSAYKTDDVETNDTNSVHSAKATHQIWEKAKSDIGDCPNDGKYYVRRHGEWVEGVVTDSVPVGTVVGYSGLSAPKGYLVLESNTIHSRSLYPALYDHLKFHCPELIIDSLSFRLCSGDGMFLRGVDNDGIVNPDGASRELLSEQGDAIRNITGETGVNQSLSGNKGALYTQTNIGNPGNSISLYTGGVGRLTIDASRVVPTSTENRPKNLNVLWIIKAFDCVNKPAIIEAESVVQQVSNNTVEIQRLEPIVSSNTENIKIIKNPNMGDKIVTCNIKYKYEHSFIVEGDLNTYYPVYLVYSTNHRYTKIEIYRNYNEPGPEEFGTHKAALSAVLYATYGGWGGSEYKLKLFAYNCAYNTTLANAAVGKAYGIALCVWLRGGGFLYHIESDQYFNRLVIGYTTDTVVYKPPDPQYATIYADPSLTAVNQSFLDTAFIT